jgi:ABC-type transport system involved in multi-copper enzyme maturation permease subunit
MTLERTWTELVTKNPMLIEITRFRRRFLTMNGANALSGVIIGLITVCYMGLVTLVFCFRSDIDPMVIVATQAILTTLIAPTLLHSAVAGERERRSWDLLLAAPITKAQIVVGKYIGAIAALGAGTTMFMFPLAVCALSHPNTNYWNLALSELVSLSFSMLVAAISLFFSARVKRSFMALGATLGTLSLGLIVFPALVEVLVEAGGSSGMRGFYNDTLFYLHPGFVLAKMSEAPNTFHEVTLPINWYGLPQILVYLGLSITMVAWAINTLNFAENEVKFIPKAKN